MDSTNWSQGLFKTKANINFSGSWTQVTRLGKQIRVPVESPLDEPSPDFPTTSQAGELETCSVVRADYHETAVT